MFPEAVRAVRELKPQGFVFENVRGLTRKSFSSYFNYILLQLSHPDVEKDEAMKWQDHLRALEEYHTSNFKAGLSYNVIFRLLNAADYGIPQMRQRVVIVGFRSDMNVNWSFPEPTHSKEALRISKDIDGSYWEEHEIAKKHRKQISLWEQDLVKRSIAGNEAFKRWQTVRDAFSGLPDPRKKATSDFPNHEFRDGARPYAGHSGSVMDEPSKTVKAGAHGVPGGENMLVLDDGSLRYYTVRESARVQTFPDNFLFHGSWTENMRQIGNAVPVRLASIIGQSIASALERSNKDGFNRTSSGDQAVQSSR
jgi:DNA (cytosine-5)-methyltransferase 1